MPEGGQTKSAWRIGWDSARANVVPMAVLWFLAGVTVFSYYSVSGVAAALEPLKRWQTESGWVAAFLNRTFFCGVLPGVFLMTVKAIRPRRPFATVAAQTLWCGAWGVVFDFFFRLLDIVFGSGCDLTTVIAKAAADEFGITLLVSAPADAVFFFWLGRDFSFRRARVDWPRTFYRDLVAPNLVSNWCVWIPVSLAVFAFPLPLQIQVSGFAAAFWTLMCLQIGVRTARKEVGVS